MGDSADGGAPGDPVDAGAPDPSVDGGEKAFAFSLSGGLPRPAGYRPPNGEVIAVAFDPAGNILVQSREPATLQILTQRLAPIVLSYESRADQGHQLFHSATSGKLACASCHPEGGEDGRVWRFVGHGERRTQSLRGGIMDTAPFHWSGDQPTLEHLMGDVFQGRMGGAKVERSRVTALGRWLDQVPAITPSPSGDAAARARGQALFESGELACATCHRGPDFSFAHQLRRRHRRTLPGPPAAQPGLPGPLPARRLRHHPGRALHHLRGRRPPRPHLQVDPRRDR